MARHPQFGNVITEKKRGVSNFELQWNTVLKIVNQFGNGITEKMASCNQWRVLNKVNTKKIGFGKCKH